MGIALWLGGIIAPGSSAKLVGQGEDLLPGTLDRDDLPIAGRPVAAREQDSRRRKQERHHLGFQGLKLSEYRSGVISACRADATGSPEARSRRAGRTGRLRASGSASEACRGLSRPN